MLGRGRTSVVGLGRCGVSRSWGLAGGHGGRRGALDEGWVRGGGVGSTGGRMGVVLRRS